MINMTISERIDLANMTFNILAAMSAIIGVVSAHTLATLAASQQELLPDLEFLSNFPLIFISASLLIAIPSAIFTLLVKRSLGKKGTWHQISIWSFCVFMVFTFPIGTIGSVFIAYAQISSIKDQSS